MSLMKRFVRLSALACTVVLLSACPDTKLPSPTPKVPEPKAQTAAQSAAVRTLPAVGAPTHAAPRQAA